MLSLKSCSIAVTMLYLKYLWKACQIDHSVRLAPISNRMVQKALDILLSEWSAGAHPPSVVFSSNHLNTSFRDFCLFPFSLVFDDECMAGYHCLAEWFLRFYLRFLAFTIQTNGQENLVFQMLWAVSPWPFDIHTSCLMVFQIQPICSTKINRKVMFWVHAQMRFLWRPRVTPTGHVV